MKMIKKIRKGSGEDLTLLRTQRLFYHVTCKVADRDNVHLTVERGDKQRWL